MIHIHNGALLNHKEQNYIIFREMDGIGNQLLSETNPSETQITHGFCHIQNIDVSKYREVYRALLSGGEY